MCCKFVFTLHGSLRTCTCFYPVRFSDCPTNIFGRQSYFYILSDERATADRAQSLCMNANGKLAEINDTTFQNESIQYAIARHINPSGL